MKYVSFNQIIECNGILAERGLQFKIHLRDACGRQSCWVEPLGDCACEGHWDEMYDVLKEYFSKEGFELCFDADKVNFWVDQG